MKLFFLVSLLCLSLTTHAANTGLVSIKQIRYNATSERFFVETTTTWGVACNGNTVNFVIADSDLPGQKEIISLALAAKMGNRKVQFWGVCDPSNNDNFKADYILVN